MAPTFCNGNLRSPGIPRAETYPPENRPENEREREREETFLQNARAFGKTRIADDSSEEKYSPERKKSKEIRSTHRFTLSG